MGMLAVSREQYTTIINALFNGIESGDRRVEPNAQLATIFQVEANTGLRIGDVLALKRGDIVYENDRYRFDIVESKTGKKRTFIVPVPVYEMIERYCEKYGISQGQQIFNIKVRNTQKILAKLCDILDYKKIGTHSFRKYFATKAYNESEYDIELVRRLLQHSSASTTAKYIGITDERTANVLNACVDIV